MFETNSRLIKLRVQTRLRLMAVMIFVPLLFLACTTGPGPEPASDVLTVGQVSGGPVRGGEVVGSTTEMEERGGSSQPTGPGEQYLDRPCDPVERAGIEQYEDLVLPDPVAIVEQTEVILPSAWLVYDDIAVSGFPNSYFCATATSIAHNLPFNRLPFDRTTVENLGSFAGISFDILVDTDDVQVIAVSVQPWTDQKTSVFGPNAVQLTPVLITRDGIRIYSFRPLSKLVQDEEYILGMRFVFPDHNEITYLWKMSG